MLDEDEPKIFGLDEMNKKLPVYVVEGPLDSTFIDNSIALCGSDGDVGCLDYQISFSFTITNHVIEKSLEGLKTVSDEMKVS